MAFFSTVGMVYCCYGAKQFSLVALAQVSSLFNCLTGTARENKWAREGARRCSKRHQGKMMTSILNSSVDLLAPREVWAPTLAGHSFCFKNASPARGIFVYNVCQIAVSGSDRASKISVQNIERSLHDSLSQ